MCGRFSSALKPSDVWLELMQDWSDTLFDRYNVSPGSQIGAFVDGCCDAMRWGLVPSWSKDISTKYATFNARIESIEDKPAFRNAWRKKQKCLIPAQGYYEWRTEDGHKQPYFVTLPDEQPVVFAGLWDECMIGDGALRSCTIITTEASDELKSLHHRMPVMLAVETAKRWLATDTSTADSKSLLVGSEHPEVSVYAVDRRVNKASEDDEGLIVPLS